MQGPKKVSSCAQWNSGIACSMVSAAEYSAAVITLTYCAITDSCVSIAPFGSDSVPLV